MRSAPVAGLRTGLARFPGMVTAAAANAAFMRLIVAAATSVCLAVILLFSLAPERVEITVGQPSKLDIEAPRTVRNNPATDRLKSEAARLAVKQAAQVVDNYDISQVASISAEESLRQVFSLAAEARAGMEGTSRKGAARAVSDAEAGALVARIRSAAGVTLSAKEAAALLTHTASELDAVGDRVAAIVGKIMKEERIAPEGLEQAVGRASALVKGLGLPKDLESCAVSLVRAVIHPNLVLDPEKVERARNMAERSVEPVMILKGQTIIRRGEIVTAEHQRILEDLGLLGPKATGSTVAGIALVVGMLVWLMGVYLARYEKETYRDVRKLALIGSVLVVVSAMGSVVLSLKDWEGAGYLFPAALGCVLVATLVNNRLALVTSVAVGILAGVMAGSSFKVAVVAIVGGMSVVFCASRVVERWDLVKGGFLAGACMSLATVGLSFVSGDPTAIGRSWYLGLVNGVLSTALALGFLPALEGVFHVTSSVRLLELCNPTQTVLRRLLLEAPGTYHHSIVVGNLAEAAAEAVGGDSLLVRVSSYYHDIGKLRRPTFFVENQILQDNPHDKLSPRLSTLVITSHVKDGVETGRRYRLPDAVLDIIQQHHGTSVVSYFYHRAAENGQGHEVSAEDFRYPGPKPQTKEAAIVMAADSVEAAVRSLSKPTVGKLEALVRKIVRDKLNDGQFDECALTLKDLEDVAGAFVKVLAGITHERIEYPDLAGESETRKPGSEESRRSDGDRSDSKA